MAEVGLLPLARVALQVATQVLPPYRSRFSKHLGQERPLIARAVTEVVSLRIILPYGVRGVQERRALFRRKVDQPRRGVERHRVPVVRAPGVRRH